MKLLRSSLIFSAFTLLSRIAGFVRDALQGALFGTGTAASAFVVAYRIPNYLRRIFAEGSFASAFVPVLSELREKGDQAALQDFLDHVAGALLAVVVVVTGLGILAAPWIARLFLLFAGKESDQVALVAEMLRITFPYLTFISMTALAGSVLNSFRQFGLPAFAPVLHNLGVIAGMLLLAPLLAIPAKALAWGVTAAGLLQLLLLWPAMRRLGLRTRLRFNFRHEGVRRVFRLMLPTVFSSSVAQINLLVGTMFASLLVVQAQSWLYFSDRLIEFPLGLFGVAIGTVILPHLSRRHAAEDMSGYGAALDWGMRCVLLIALPAATGLAVLAEPLVSTLFRHGRFNHEDARMTAISIQAMCIGVPGFMLSKVLLPAFYARQDTRTPMRIAIRTVVANVVLTVALVTPLWYYEVMAAHAGIALATALAGLLNAWWLWRRLGALGWYRPQAGWAAFLMRVSAACIVMAIGVHWLSEQLAPWMLRDWEWRLLGSLLLVALGAAIFALTLWLLGIRPRMLREPPA
jgi:putative peptidoglycan lipid II flippase